MKQVKRKTMARDVVARLAFCNSSKLPGVIEYNGSRRRWVGIGWVDEGAPHGNEVLVVEDDGTPAMEPKPAEKKARRSKS